jgi:hypothetical protein
LERVTFVCLLQSEEGEVDVICVKVSLVESAHLYRNTPWCCT